MTVSDIGADLDHDTAGTPQPTPTPGSTAAIAQGCKCPVVENGHGAGWNGSGLYVMVADCPVHPMDAKDADHLRRTAEWLDRNT